MKIKVLIVGGLFLSGPSLVAQTQALIDQEKIIIQSLWYDIGHSSVLFKPNSPNSPGPKVTPRPSPEPSPEPRPNDPDTVIKKREKKLSRGELFVKQQREKNRAKIQELHQREKSQAQAKTDSDSPDQTLLNRYKSTLSRWKQDQRDQLLAWEKQIEETHREWAKKRADFIKNWLPIYRDNQIVLEDFVPEVSQQKSKLIRGQKEMPPHFHVLPGALQLPIKSQGKRPTCAAFAGIRGVETLLIQQGQKQDLSEQYFYWASKPRCQKSPCLKRGSWVKPGFSHSQAQSQLDIPNESECPYQITTVSNNETQLPLKQQCHRGVAQVVNYQQLNSYQQIIASLLNNHPVVLGLRLTPQFYQTTGYVGLRQKTLSSKVDNHAKGHALLAIGIMKLPKSFHLIEGSHCLIVANSWGEGWGRGGHGCLSENWIRQQLVDRAIMNLSKVKI